MGLSAFFSNLRPDFYEQHKSKFQEVFPVSSLYMTHNAKGSCWKYIFRRDLLQVREEIIGDMANLIVEKAIESARDREM